MADVHDYDLGAKQDALRDLGKSKVINDLYDGVVSNPVVEMS